MTNTFQKLAATTISLGVFSLAITTPAAAQSFDFSFSFGNFGNNNGEFNQPRGIALDQTGNIYVADKNNHRIQIFDQNGGFLDSFGNFGSNNGQFNNPRGIALDLTGNIYVVDTDNNRIQVFDNSTEFSYGFGSFLR